MKFKHENNPSWLKKGLIGLSFFTAFLFPTNAYADEGVFLRDIELKNGDVVRKFKDGEFIKILETKKYHYVIEKDDQRFSVQKNNVLKTHVQKESHYEAKEDEVTLYLDTSFLSIPLQKIKKGEELYFTDEKTEEWIKVKTILGIEGWVYKSDVELKYKEVPTTTTGYIQNNITVKDKTFRAGEKVALSGYENNKFKILVDENIYEVHEKHIGFEKPKRKMLIEHGFKQLGKPYIFGANGPDAWDCSSFVQHTFRQIGVYLPRTALQQSKFGHYVEYSKMEEGDLLFFETYKEGASHVGIYLGDGKMLHAGTSGGVSVADLNDNYWKQRYLFSKRILMN